MTETTAPDPNHWRSTRKVVVLATRLVGYLVYFYVLAVEVILFLGFFLLLFGANPSSGFAEWIYHSLDRTMEPFRGIFTPVSLGTTPGSEITSIFETSVLFAMIIYGVAGIAFNALITWLTHRLDLIENEEKRLPSAPDQPPPMA